jgi:hypothetical protein
MAGPYQKVPFIPIKAINHEAHEGTPSKPDSSAKTGNVPIGEKMSENINVETSRNFVCFVVINAI